MSPSSVLNFSPIRDAFVFYGGICEVYEIKKKLKRNFVRSYLGNDWTDFLQIWYVDSHNWPARL